MSQNTERLWLLALVGAVALLYLQGLPTGPVDWDDKVWLEDPIRTLPFFQAVGVAFFSFHDAVYPPLLRLSFWALGEWPAMIHVLNLGLFLGSIVGIHAVLRRLGVPAVASLVALALWATHPTKVECVAWITGLKDLQSLAFLVGMALALVPHAEEAPSERRIILGTALGAGALLTKAAVFPVPFLLAAILARRSGAREAGRRFGAVAGLALVLAAVGAAAWAPHDWPPMPRFWVPLWVHGEFWARLVPSMPAAIVPIPADPRPIAMVGVVLTVASGVAAARWPTVGVPALLTWLLPQLPFLGLVPMEFWASDRHLLIPTLGPAVALAIVAERASRYPWPLLLVLWFAPISARRVHDWRDAMTLWEAESRRPGEHWARWHKLAMVYGLSGRFAESEAAFDRSLALNPTDRSTLARRVVASLAVGGFTRVEAQLARLFQPPPASDADWSRAIVALRDAGEEDLAAFAERHIELPGRQ